MSAKVSKTTITKKMRRPALSNFIMSIKNFLETAVRNGFYVPKMTCSAVNDSILFNVL